MCGQFRANRNCKLLFFDGRQLAAKSLYWCCLEVLRGSNLLDLFLFLLEAGLLNLHPLFSKGKFFVTLDLFEELALLTAFLAG